MNSANISRTFMKIKSFVCELEAVRCAAKLQNWGNDITLVIRKNDFVVCLTRDAPDFRSGVLGRERFKPVS